MATWDYLPRARWTPLTPWRRWRASRRPYVGMAPGEEYLGWTVRIADNAGPDLPAAGTKGIVMAVEQRVDGVLVHHLEFPGGVVVARSLEWPDREWAGIDLLAPR